jgi:hypothetical protein
MVDIGHSQGCSRDMTEPLKQRLRLSRSTSEDDAREDGARVAARLLQAAKITYGGRALRTFPGRHPKETEHVCACSKKVPVSLGRCSWRPLPCCFIVCELRSQSFIRAFLTFNWSCTSFLVGMIVALWFSNLSFQALEFVISSLLETTSKVTYELHGCAFVS